MNYPFTLLKNCHVYSPQDIGIKDILIGDSKIVSISDQIDLPNSWEIQVISCENRIVTPGFIDLHVHLLGGGGEGGPATRVSAITVSQIVKAGVTTVVGCLGTDDVSRRPEELLVKAMQLEAEGISAYIYTGSYQVPPPTITGSIRRDLALLPKVLGVGEIAISDHRSSQPTFDELCRIASDARVGGMLGGKAGVVHLHVGSGRRKLTPILQIVEETEIPIVQFLPTHLSRTPELLDHALEFALRGGNIDFTVKGEDLNSPISTEQAITQALHHGVSLSQITLSSDSNGSMPVFDKDGQMIRLGVGDICNLYRDVQVLIQKGFPLVDVLTMVTRNPAERLGLLPWKGTLETGKDADILILTQDLGIEAVMAKGKFLFQNGRIQSLSPFGSDS